MSHKIETKKWLSKNSVQTLTVEFNGQKEEYAVLYKSVRREDYLSSKSHSYSQKSYATVKMLKPYTAASLLEAPDWSPTPYCGAGLHLSPTPRAARFYYNGSWTGKTPRFMACLVKVSDIVPLDSVWTPRNEAKCKVPRLKVLEEVKGTVSGEPIRMPRVGDKVVSRKGGHDVEITAMDDATVTIRTLSGKDSKMKRKSLNKSYVTKGNALTIDLASIIGL